MKDGDGFAYGEGIYSAEIYSWETFWEELRCQASDTRRENSVHFKPVPPPPAVPWVLAPCVSEMDARRKDSAYGD